MNADDLLAALCRGDIPYFIQDADGQQYPARRRFAALVPGSFDPPHVGHFGIAAAAARWAGGVAAFELSVINADKPPLTVDALRRRLAVLVGHGPVVASRAPTFVEKARLWPDTVFAVGCDTAERIIDPKYYEDRGAALAEVRRHGCRFLVAGRVVAGGEFRGLRHLALSPELADLFFELSESDFREDVSSTALRAARQAGGGSVGHSP